MNRKNVIEGLETIKQFFGYGLPSTAEMFDSYNGTLKDALALLKEQEAVEPIRQTEQTEWTVCGHCRKHLITKWMFCPYCGRAVKWNDCNCDV